jgi:hypothetical protein
MLLQDLEIKPPLLENINPNGFIHLQAVDHTTSTMANSMGIVLITGANGGLGSVFVWQFLKSSQASAHVGLFTVRNPFYIPPKKIVSDASRPPSHHEILSLNISSLALWTQAPKPSMTVMFM